MSKEAVEYAIVFIGIAAAVISLYGIIEIATQPKPCVGDNLNLTCKLRDEFIAYPSAFHEGRCYIFNRTEARPAVVVENCTFLSQGKLKLISVSTGESLPEGQGKFLSGFSKGCNCNG